MIRERREELRELPVERCCQVLKVSRSEYYRRLKEPAATGDTGDLDRLVSQASDERTVYGYRRISAHLRRKGHVKASDKRVRRSMKRLGLNRRRRRKRPLTTTPGKAPACPNRLKEARVSAPREALVTDLTYVALPQGFGYVSVVLDAFSRRALGWAASESLGTELPKEALETVLQRHPLKEGWIHHSDRGSQYTSGPYRELVLSQKGVLSNSRKGNPYDNAAMESFFKTYKCEEASLTGYGSLEELRSSLEAFLHDYNHERLHSSLGYLSPAEFEELHYQNLHAEQEEICVR